MSKSRPQPQAAAGGEASSARLRLQLRRQTLLLIGLVSTLVLLAALFGLLDGPELQAVSWAFRLRGRQPAEAPITIVAIDDDTFSLNNLQWPWPRTYFAQIVDRLSQAGAAAIAFDVFFFEPEALGTPATYTVQGETLSEIAKRYGVPVADVIAANQLDNSGRVCGGQALTIPSSPVVTHIVQRDTLEVLAARYGVTPEAILKRNDLSQACDLRPAQLLQIPSGPEVVYTVEPGQTVRAVAALFQVNSLAVEVDGQPAADPLTPGQSVTVRFGDAALAAALRGARNVILNGEIARSTQSGALLESLRQPLPELMDAAAGFGITNIDADADGTVHSIKAWDTALDQTHYSWPLVAGALALGERLPAAPERSAFSLGGRAVPLQSTFLLVNYRGPEKSIPTYPAYQVVNGDLPLETFAGRIVFIGATTQSLHDVYAMPFVPKNPPGMPGVEIMANALETALSGDFMNRFSGVCAGRVCPIAARAPLLLAIIVCSLLALGLTFIRQISLAIAALAGLMLAGLLIWLGAFAGLNTQIPLVAPLGTLFVAFITPTLERAVSEELEKRRVRGIFEMFISPEMVGQLIDQGIDAMRGKRTELTILFSDIRGFTTMSEKMTPEGLVNLLNEYLGAMTEVIHRHGGTVDKYEGDLVMAFFGAPVAYPDHAERAVRCSIDMRVELDRLRAKWAQEGKPSKLEMGIGLNTAEVFVGLVGSGRRVNYTVMGDGVNLASRVQDLTKDLKWPLLITEFTYEKVKDQFECEFGDARLVKGKTVPIGMYKVLGEKGAPEERRVRALFA